LKQVSCGSFDAGGVDVVVDVVVDDAQGAAEFEGGGWSVGVEEGAEGSRS
jgi:hypothetical protein